MEQAASRFRCPYWLLACLLAWLPSRAWAQIDDLAESDPLFSGVATLSIAAISLIVIAWQRRRVRREGLRADHFAERTSLLEAALESAPWPYFGWTASGSPLIDPAFSTALGGAEIETMEDLFAMLETGDAVALKSALKKLRADGSSFDLSSHRPDLPSVRLIGRRGHGLHAGSDGKTGQVDMIWLADTGSGA